MGKKAKIVIVSLILISSLVVGSVSAFYKGEIDGQWGVIDSVQYIDVIGQVGYNPPSGEWGSDDLSTGYATIRRLPNICIGDSVYNDPFTLVQWRGFPDRTFDGLGSHTATCSGPELFISEYVHATGALGFSDYRAIEIFNPTNYPVPLAGYKIQMTEDGSSSVTVSIDLDPAGVVPLRGTWVIANRDRSGTDEDQIDSALDFTGNDAVGLVKGGSDGTNLTGADCDNWATGPAGGPYPDVAPTTLWGSYTPQSDWSDGNPPYTDWNQVRYGRPEGESSCPTTIDKFQKQSGFGFDGASTDGLYYGKNQPFVMGVFCHYNKPIYAPETTQGKFGGVPLDITVSGIRCDDPGQSIPVGGDTKNFTYYFRLDETPNSAPCTYPSSTNCADAVFVSQAPSNQSFTCDYGTSTVTYVINVLGFMQRNSNGSCPVWNASQAMRDFISNEGTTNCGCMYGMISDEIITAVELLYFNAQPGDGVITLQWATATERDNYGFNLYRATSEDGERTRLNEALIPSLVAPGSLFGAEYEFVDSTAEAGVQYYYWLEDVDIHMLSTFHGPVGAILE